MRSLYAIAFIAGLAVTAAVAQQGAAGRASQDGPVALVGGTLIDGTGKAPVRDSVVLIRGGRIEVVGTTDSLPVPNGYETVSTEEMTVLPGLWDLHVHLMYAGHPNPRYWLDDEQRRRLAVRGERLACSLLREFATLVTPGTILRWHRELVPEMDVPTRTSAKGDRACRRPFDGSSCGW